MDASGVSEGMLSEFEYYQPSVIQSAIVQEYDDMISPTTAINTDAANSLNTLEFVIKGATDLYRDLNNSTLMLKVKVTDSAGDNLTATAAVAPTNLPLHSLFSSVSVTLGGKEVGDAGTLYPYRAYLETLLSSTPEVLKSRAPLEGWAKDDAEYMDALAVAHVAASQGVTAVVANNGFLARRNMIKSSRVLTLIGRPHVDLFHQPLDIPPDVTITVKLTPSPAAFSLMETSTGTSKWVLQDAKMFIRTKKVDTALIVAHKQMLSKTNMRFAMNRVTVNKYNIGRDFQSTSVSLNYPGKLPKRLFIGFVKNSASTGARNENPFNFEHFKLSEIGLTVNGTPIPAYKLTADFEKKEVQQVYLNTLASLGLDTTNRALDITQGDFCNGYAIYGFKVAPGPIDGTVISTANSVGNLVVNVTFKEKLAASVDMIVFAESPATLEIDKVGGVTLI